MKQTPPPGGPTLPAIRLEAIEDLSPVDPGGFLKLIRRRYRAHYPDGSVSEPFLYDAIDRTAIDAVVICAYYSSADGPVVYLRSALRPPLVMRAPERGPFQLAESAGGLWELPAGLVEERDQNASGPRLTAQRELYEELGFRVAPDTLRSLGPAMLPAPGFIAEQHFFYAVAVNPSEREEPGLDGSPLEHFGQVIALPLERALSLCREGQIRDAKTELALRRLAEELF